MSTTPARSSVATVYSRCERELAFLGTHGYTFRVRPPSQIRGYLTPTRHLGALETATSLLIVWVYAPDPGCNRMAFSSSSR